MKQFIKSCLVLGSLLIALSAALSFADAHALTIKQVQPAPPNTYLVDGKEVNVAEAMTAFLANKKVFKCAVKKATAGKTLMIDGKVIDAKALSTCTEVELQAGKSGVNFKTKKAD